MSCIHIKCLLQECLWTFFFFLIFHIFTSLPFSQSNSSIFLSIPPLHLTSISSIPSPYISRVSECESHYKLFLCVSIIEMLNFHCFLPSVNISNCFEGCFSAFLSLFFFNLCLSSHLNPWHWSNISHFPLVDIVRLSLPHHAELQKCLSRADSGYLKATPAAWACVFCVCVWVCECQRQKASLLSGDSKA